MTDFNKNILFFIFVSILTFSYTIPIIVQGTDDLRMIDAFDVDESTLTDIVATMVSRSSLYPQGRQAGKRGFFNYGTVYFYITCFALWLAKFFSFITQITDQHIIILLRGVNVVFAILSIWALFILSKRIYGFKTALLASFLFMMTPDFVRWSTVAHPDVPQLFFIIMCIYFCSVLVEEYSLNKVILAAVFAGLSFATKYAGIFLIPMVWLSVVVSLVKRENIKVGDMSFINFINTNRLFAKQILQILLLTFFLFIIVFAVTNPYAIIEYKKLLNTLHYEMRHVSYGHKFKADRNPFLWFKLLCSDELLGVSGFLLFTFCLLTFIFKIIKMKPKKISDLINGSSTNLIWIVSFFFYLFFRVNMRRGRYMFPILPFMCIFIAHICFQIIYDKTSSKKIVYSKIFLVAIMLIWAVWPKIIINYNYLQLRLTKVQNTTRITAGKWLKDHFPPDIKILYDRYSYIPPIYKDVKRVPWQKISLLESYTPDIIVVNRRNYGRFEDISKASTHRKGKRTFMKAYYFYHKLEKEQLLSYKKIKEFGDVRIYKKVNNE